ncbi:uncharacterized protein LOC113304170 [Papaver somniferum]|uniref:uncharacterized protein LOC113304170 n=1 Tax=Papaver somniferum TaxID=3469 RepID=UPI000E7029B7|nr:uncharacterized protein LOC113304170 [Papaver somniferum]
MSEYCNHTLYQFFRAKALKLEAKLRHREEELSTDESLIYAKDKEIQDLKNILKGKEQLGAKKEQFRLDLALTRSELEEARKGSSSNSLITLRGNLLEATEHASSLAEKVEQLEGDLSQARSSHDPEVTNYIHQIVQESDDARAEAHALSNTLIASRADVAHMVESERNLEMNMYRLNKGIEKMNDKVNHLRHKDSMKQVELDESRYTLSNLQLDYKKISDEFDFLAEGRNAVVYDLETSSARVRELEGQLVAANAKIEKAQSSLVQQESQTSYYKGLAGSRDEAAKEAAKKVPS